MKRSNKAYWNSPGTTPAFHFSVLWQTGIIDMSTKDRVLYVMLRNGVMIYGFREKKKEEHKELKRLADAGIKSSKAGKAFRAHVDGMLEWMKGIS